MALNKNSVNISFGQGIDTKTDSKQVSLGKMLSLENAIFQRGGLLQKRNGFKKLPALPVTDTNTLTTFGGSLVAVGKTLQNYSGEAAAWFDKGSIVSVETDVMPMVRTSTSQASQDVAVSPSGLACSVWQDSDGTCRYQVNDINSTQILASNIQLPTDAAQPRVFVLGIYFIVTFLVPVGGATHLQYIAIPTATPTSPGAATDFLSALQADGLTAGYDGIVSNNSLYIALSDIAGQINLFSINSNLVESSGTGISGHTADFMSVTVDSTQSPAIIWVTFHDPNDNNIYTSAFNSDLSVVPAFASPATIASSVTIAGLTSTAINNSLTAYYQTVNVYSGTSIRSDYISTNVCTSGAVVGSPNIILRSVGLGSKGFILGGTPYIAVAYGGSYQPTYFLSDSAGNLVAKLAYSNGGGYAASEVLPSVTVQDSTAFMGYLYKGTLTPVNKAQGVANVAGIYSQLGINLVSWTINNSSMPVADIGQNLHLGGGFLWMYDGTLPVEHGFHVWPEDVSATTSNAITPTGDVAITSNVITNVSSLVDVAIGQTITGSGIDSGTTITAILSATSIQISKPAIGNAIGTTLTINGALVAQDYFYQVTYEWTDAQGNIHRSAPSVPLQVTTTGTSFNTITIPTLRLTYKTEASKVRVVIYRWSTAQQNYYQVTSIQDPLLNNPSVDTVSFIDPYSDAQILGNQLIYTTGGVVENIPPPAVADLTLFRSRLIVLSAEDRNVVWYSKQVIQNTPVETSDLFTIYNAPTIGSQGSTGNGIALSAMDDKLIIFKRDAIYYIVGNGPDNTGANNDFSDPIYVTSTAGCKNRRSILFMPQGVMFQSDKGIWLLGRDLSTQYIGADVERYNQIDIVSAINVPGTNQVRFTLNQDVTLMYDYYYGQWGTFTGIPAISSTLFESLHTYVNTNGAVYQENPGSYVDGSAPVLLQFSTGWIALSGLQGLERAYFFYLLGEYLSPHKLTVAVSYDYDPAVVQNTVITPDNFNYKYGNEPGVFGSGSPYGGVTNIEQWRVFLARQKCQSFSLAISESYDPAYGELPGAGLTLSGINLIVGAKRSNNTIKAANSVG